MMIIPEHEWYERGTYFHNLGKREGRQQLQQELLELLGLELLGIDQLVNDLLMEQDEDLE